MMSRSAVWGARQEASVEFDRLSKVRDRTAHAYIHTEDAVV
jgi:hypothetical protein